MVSGGGALPCAYERKQEKVEELTGNSRSV